MRGAGYLGPLVIDAGGSGQDVYDIINCASAIQTSDPQQNCIFSYHAYGTQRNYQATIQSATNANPCVLTLNSTLPYHPLKPDYSIFDSNQNPGNGATGSNVNTLGGWFVSGALGMTQLNGQQACPGNTVGGTSGAWTVTLSGNSTSWGTYTANSAQIVAPYDYRQYIGDLAALRSSNICVGVFEFGPGSGPGPPIVAWSGYISGTTMTVDSMLTPGAIFPGSISTAGYTPGVNYNINGPSGSPITSNTKIVSQSSGTTGGAGAYVVDTSQTAGSSGSPITIIINSVDGGNGNFYGPTAGPSTSPTSLGQIISAYEANFVPWCFWALDDHNISAGQECSYFGWFGMCNAGTNFSTPSTLTAAGMDMVFNPCYGLRTLAQPPSSFA
jgi:hypothetical protein